MIKLTKQPDPIKCKICGAEYTFDKEDVKSLPYQGNDMWIIKFVFCPNCGEENVISYMKLTDKIKGL